MTNAENDQLLDGINAGWGLCALNAPLGHSLISERDFNKKGIRAPIVMDRDFGGAKRGDVVRALLAPSSNSSNKDYTCVVSQKIKPKSVGKLIVSCGSVRDLPDAIRNFF